MGNALVNRAIALRPNYAHVSVSAFVVLLAMSRTALDRDQAHDDGPTVPARHYYAGWRLLALMLGHKDPGDEKPLPPAAKQAVARAVRELTDCGLIGRAAPEIDAAFRHRVYVIRI